MRLARAGLRVALLDRRPQGQAGAQWVNGVASWIFDEADVERPQAPELLGSGHRFSICSPVGKARVDVDDNPILEVDMRLLGQRLAQQCADAGGAVMWGMNVDGVEAGKGNRPAALLAKGPNGQRWRLRARVYVDATGLAAVLRQQIPSLQGACPEPDPEHICVAAQEVRHVKDPGGAMDFLETHNAARGQTLAWTGQHGGFSVLNVRVAPDLSEVSILTGAIAQPQYPSGRKILDRFVASHPWIGSRVFGGSRAIPLRRPYTRLVAPGVALLGDSACQVFSAHGSGIGMGLLAARMLADVIIEAADLGDDPGAMEVLWTYAQGFHKRWAGLLVNSDAFRRMSQTFTDKEIDKLMRSGLMAKGMVAATLGQRPVVLGGAELPGVLLGALRAPTLTARLLPLLLRMPLVNFLAATYPEYSAYADVDLYRYERRMRWLVGDEDATAR